MVSRWWQWTLCLLVSVFLRPITDAWNSPDIIPKVLGKE